MSSPLPIIIRDLEGVRALEAEWTDLLAHSSEPEVFYGWEWNYHFLRRYCPDDTPFVVALRDRAGALVGLAPLCIRRRRRFGVTVRVLSSIVVDIGDFRNFLVRDTARRSSVVPALLEALAASAGEWDVMDISQLSTRDPTTFHIVQAAQKSPEWTTRVEYLTPVAMRYATSLENTKRRKEVARYVKLAAGRNFAIRLGQEITDDLWARFATLHREVWPQSAFHSEAGRAFFDDLRNAPGLQGHLDFSYVEHDGEPVAFHFGFVGFGKFYYYMPVMNRAYGKEHVGHILLHSIVQRCTERDLRIDFLRGLETYKLLYTDDLSANVRVVVTPNRSLAALAHNIGDLTRSFASNLAVTKPVARRLKGLLGRR